MAPVAFAPVSAFRPGLQRTLSALLAKIPTLSGFTQGPHVDCDWPATLQVSARHTDMRNTRQNVNHTWDQVSPVLRSGSISSRLIPRLGPTG